MSKAERKWRGFSSRAAGIVQRLNTVRADLDELHREMTAVGFGYHRSSPPAVNEWFFVMDALVMAGEGMDDDADRLDAAAGALDAADWTPGDYGRPVERTAEDAHALKDAARRESPVPAGGVS